MNKIIFFSTTVCLFLSFFLSAQPVKKKKADNDTQIWRYEIQCIGQGSYGSYALKVWQYSKNPYVAIEQAKKNAIHGVIFKGYSKGGECNKSEKSLAEQSGNADIENEHPDFFTNFFSDGGPYMKYVTVSNDGMVNDVQKLNKKEYKVGVLVSVKKDMLRTHLEKEGIIKGLGQMWD